LTPLLASGSIQSDFTNRSASIASESLPINQRIRAPFVYLIDETNTPVGKVETRTALEKAGALELDLVLVAPTAQPPVAKILDYGKYKYELDRKERKNKAKKTQDVKEIRISYNTDVHDREVKIKQALRFLKEGHKLKLRLKLVGREMAFKEKGIEQLDQFRDFLNMEYEQPIQRMGKQFTVLLKEKKEKKTDN
jgi:translation initiation factor IF-3